MTCHPNHLTAQESAKRANAKRFEREIDRQHRWTHGHDPNDPDAEKGSGWEYAKISSADLTEDTRTPNPYTLKHGPASGIVCIFCHDDEMRVVDEKPVSEILAKLPGYEELVRRGVAPKLATVCMLICPKCEKTMQIREDVLRRKLNG